MKRALRLAIAGFGKIARDQHLPAAVSSAGIELVAVADPRGGPGHVPAFDSLDEMLSARPDIEAVALCTPPQSRRALAEACLRAGKHVLLEKPPGMALSELAPLLDLAESSRLTLFAAWHSRFAPAVEPARAALAGRHVRSVRIIWKEDVRVWHPGQAWIWQPGGLGVFDPGINALSVLTRILPQPPFVTGAALQFPANCDAPIAADLTLSDPGGADMTAEFDWRQTGPQTWDIAVEAEDATVLLKNGGRIMRLNGETAVEAAKAEYPLLYRRFAELIASGERDVDLSPLVLVADAFLLGRRREVEAFHDGT